MGLFAGREQRPGVEHGLADPVGGGEEGQPERGASPYRYTHRQVGDRCWQGAAAEHRELCLRFVMTSRAGMEGEARGRLRKEWVQVCMRVRARFSAVRRCDLVD